MPAAPLAALVRRMNAGPDAVADAELLDRFVRSADQAAFELLVWRHGGMVWGVCRRVLDPDRDAAEDACQAAFVALASHAARLRDGSAVATWLHRVAVRASLDLRTTRRATRSLAPDHPDTPARDPDPFRNASDREVRALLDTGLNRLPDKLRLPFVLCELEGRSNAEAAAALRCPVGTVESRLTRARRRLRDWLTARGVVPAVAVASCAVPESARAAMTRAGDPTRLSGAVRDLAARAIPSVLSAKMRAVAATGVLLVACAVGLGVTMNHDTRPSDPQPANAARPTAPEAKENGVPLPRGAVARLGSPHLRHGGWVYDIRFSADGKRIASVGSDNTVHLWDGESGKQLFVVRRKEGRFNRVAFAAEGKTLVALGHSPQMVADLWTIDVATGKVAAEKVLPNRPRVRNADPAVRFSPDGSRLAVGTAADDQLLVFDSLTAEAVWSVKLEGETVVGVGFSPDSRTVAASTNKGTVRLYDAAGKPAEVLTGDAKTGGLTNVAISPDGKMVVASAGDGVVAWDRESGKVLWKRQTRAEYSLAFSPDGKRIVCSAYGFRACTLDPADGYGGGIGGKPGAYFDWMVEATASAFKPDGSAVAFGTISGTICLFEPAEGKPVSPSADPPHEVRWARFSPGGKTLYAWSADWFAWDVATGKQTRVTNSGWNYGEPLSPDGKYTARSVWYSGARPVDSPDDGTRFEILDAKTRAVVHSHPGKLFQVMSWKEFTPDGKAIVGGLSDGTVRVWAIDTGKELLRLPGHKAASQYRAFSADGRVLVTGAFGDDAEEFPVRVYDIKAGKELAKLNPGLWVVGVAVSGDGRRVAAATSANARGMKDPREVAVVWDVASGKVLARVPQPREGKFVALSPDGRLLAIAPDWEGDVRVHEVASGEERFAFRHDGQPTDLLFSPDGRTLVAASKEAPVYLWDVAGELAGKPPAWDAKTPDAVWGDLASKDAAKAFAAIRLLRTNPADAVALLKERTKPSAVPENLKQLVADLGSEDYATREAATKALAALGEAVRASLEAELPRATVPEAKKRLGELLIRLDAATPARLRLVRAVEAVEGIGTPEAKALLEAWAGGVAGKVLAAEATAALARRAK